MASSTSVRHFFHDFHPQRHTLPTTVLHTKSSASPSSLTLSASTSSSVNTPTSVSFSSVSSTQPSKMLVVKSSSSTHLPIMEDRLDTLSHDDALLSVIPPFTKSKSSQISTLHHHDDDTEHDVSCSEHRSPSSPSSSSSLLGHLRRSFWNCKCYCLFSTLPDELMIFNLFSFFSHEELAVVAHVSKRWRWLVSDPALWKYLDFSQKKLSDHALISIIQRFGASIETLKLCNNMHLTETSLALLGVETPQLRELHLCHLHPINDSIVNAIATNCHHLQHLSLFGCTQVTDEAVKALGLNLSDTLNDLSLRNCPLLTDDSMAALPSNLRGLNIASNRRITGEGVSALAARCPRLERVNVHSILVTDQSVDCLSKNCKNLSTLHLSSSNPFGGNVRLTDQAMESLSSLKRLRCLNLQGNSSLTDHGMARLVSSLPKLQRLNLGGCYRITDLSLAFLAKHNPQLTHLSLFQCFHITDKGLMMMMLGLKSLIHLDVHSCVGLTSQTLAVLSMEVDDDESEQEESDSDNESTSPGHRESFTSDKGRTPTGKRIRSLLEDSDDEDDSEFSELDADEQMNGRTSTPRLSLSTSSRNDSISSTASNYYLPRLRTLDVGACRQVTVEDIRGLQSVRPNLQVVFHQP